VSKPILVIKTDRVKAFTSYKFTSEQASSMEGAAINLREDVAGGRSSPFGPTLQTIANGIYHIIIRIGNTGIRGLLKGLEFMFEFPGQKPVVTIEISKPVTTDLFLSKCLVLRDSEIFIM
jgi:hypothetical protein